MDPGSTEVARFFEFDFLDDGLGAFGIARYLDKAAIQAHGRLEEGPRNLGKEPEAPSALEPKNRNRPEIVVQTQLAGLKVRPSALQALRGVLHGSHPLHVVLPNWID